MRILVGGYHVFSRRKPIIDLIAKKVEDLPTATVAVIRKQKRTQRRSPLQNCAGYAVLVCAVLFFLRSSFGTNTTAAVRSNRQTNLDHHPDTEDHASLKLKSKSELKVNTLSSASAMSTVATIKTQHGSIKFRFRDDKAPKHAAFMRSLIGDGLYNGCVFYRAEPNFVLQGGLRDSAGNQRQKSIENPPLEFDLLNKRGTVTMARWEDTNSGSGEFFINLKDSPHLDRTGNTGWALGFTVFGEVVEGLDVAEKIGMLPTTAGALVHDHSTRAVPTDGWHGGKNCEEGKEQGGLRMLNNPVVMDSVTLS